MLALRRKINFAFAVLTPTPSVETIGVRLRDGEMRYVSWGGFVDRKMAEEKPGAKFVKLDVHEYTANYSGNPSWVRMHKGAFVRGCVVPYQNASGYVAYAVTTDGELLIVN